MLISGLGQHYNNRHAGEIFYHAIWLSSYVMEYLETEDNWQWRNYDNDDYLTDVGNITLLARYIVSQIDGLFSVGRAGKKLAAQNFTVVSASKEGATGAKFMFKFQHVTFSLRFSERNHFERRLLCIMPRNAPRKRM